MWIYKDPLQTCSALAFIINPNIPPHSKLVQLLNTNTLLQLLTPGRTQIDCHTYSSSPWFTETFTHSHRDTHTTANSTWHPFTHKIFSRFISFKILLCFIPPSFVNTSLSQIMTSGSQDCLLPFIICALTLWPCTSHYCLRATAAILDF